MARVNVYLPDELAERAGMAKLKVSALTQAAIAAELQRQSTRWPACPATPARSITTPRWRRWTPHATSSATASDHPARATSRAGRPGAGRLLAGTELADQARKRLAGAVMHAPAHVDVEVLSALGRLHRADKLEPPLATDAVAALGRIPLSRHPLPDLLGHAWDRRDYLRITNGLYVALAEQLHMPLLTTDRRLARAYPQAEAIGA
jgi:predicted nucleic acid-binding protein/post-segregation antitoxin (ccd killing protein)